MKPRSSSVSNPHPLKTKASEVFNLVFHDNPLPMWVFDETTLRFLDANPAAIKRYGYSHAEFLKMQVSDISHEQALLRPKKLSKPIDRRSGEIKHRARDGSVFQVLITTKGITYKGHKASMDEIREVIEEKRAEEQPERRFMELETLYETGLVLSQTLDPKQIGEKIIGVLSQRLHLHHAALRIRREDSDEVELLAFSEMDGRADPLEIHQLTARNAITKIGQGMAGWVIQHGRMLNSGNLPDDPRYHETFPNMLSGLYVPIWAGGRVLGCISVEIDQRNAFTEADELLLTTLASQAAAALENARLFAETRRRTAESNNLYEATRDLTAQTDLSTLLQTLAERVAALLKIPGGGVYLYDPEKDELEIVSATHESLPIGTRLKLGEGMAGRVAEKREALIVQDYENWEGRSSKYSDQPFAAVLEVPMLYRGELIGVIAGYHLHPEGPLAGRESPRFTEEDLRLVSLFAASAAGAIYSARLFDAERVRRQEAERLRQIAVQSAERLSALHAAVMEIAGISQEPEQVYASIHQAAFRLMPTEAFAITLIDEENHEIDGVYLFDKDGRNPSLNIPFGQEFSSKVILSGETILINDLTSVDFKPYHFGSQEYVRSVLAVPLRVGGHVIGAMSAQSYQPDTYNEEDRVLLEMLAAQAAIAIENARLFDQTSRRLNEFESLAKAGEALTGTLELSPLLENILQAACQAIPAAEKGTILLRGENEHGHLHVRAQVGYADARMVDLPFDDSKGYSGRAFHEKRPILIRDSQAEYEVLFDRKLEEVNAVKSAIVAPLIVKGQAIGAIALDNASRKSAFSKEDLRLLVLFASSAAVVIENARLFGETRQRADEFEVLYELTRGIGAHQQDLSSLLPTLAERAAHLLGSYGGAIYLYSALRNDLELNFVFPDGEGVGAHLKLGEGAAGRVAQTRVPLILDDYENWEYHSPGLDGVPYRAILQVPMIYGGDLMGVLELFEYGDSKRKFNEADIKLLSLFAAHAAGAIHNTLLFDDARKASAKFANLYETAHDLSGQHNLDDLLNLIVDRAGSLLNASISGIYLYDEIHNDLYVAVNRGLTTSLGIRLAMGEGVAGRVAQTRQPMIIDDHRVWEGRSPHYEGVPLRSVLQVPMLYGGDLIGVLTVDEIGDSERKFTQDDASLLSLFASQAAAVVYSTRLFEKVSQRAGVFEALYQTASDLSSQSDLPTLLNTITERAWVLTGAAGAGLYLFDQDRGNLELVAVHDPDIQIGLHLELGEGISGKVAQTRQPLLINNYETWEHRSPKFEGMPLTSMIAVPMLYSGELVGVLDVFNRADQNIDGRPREFGEQDKNLISLFANAAAGAVYGARLLDQARRRVEELDAIARVSSALRTAVTRAEMASTILTQLREILQADGAAFLRLNPATQDMENELSQGTLEHLTGLMIPAGKGLSAQVIRSRQVYSTLDLRNDLHVFEPHLVVNVRSAALVPLVSQDIALGILWVTRDEKDGMQPPVFNERHLRIFSAIADITANAIQRVSLFEQTTHYADQLVTVNAMGHALSETLDLPGIYEKASLSALDLLPDTSGITISLFDPQAKLITIVYKLQDGEPLDVTILSALAFDESGAGNRSKVILTASPLIVSDLNGSLQDEQGGGLVGSTEIKYARSALYVPMKAEGRVIGVLQLESYTKNRYSPTDAELLELAANTTASAIQNTRLFSQLKRRVDQLSALHAVDTAIGSTTDLRVSLQTVMENITRQLQVDAADVLLLNPSTLVLHYSAGVGFLTSEIMNTSISIGRGQDGKAALERRMVQIPDLNAENTGFLRSNLVASERFAAFVAVPLIAKGEVKGVLEIFQRGPLDMNEERKSFLQMLAGQAALAIDNAKMFESLEKANVELIMAYDATIEGWSQALELRDQETQGHSTRVLELTLRLIAAMHLPDKETQDIRRGVLLHDIGKMGIPDSILHKPGPLTPQEWDVMHKHPQYAFDMLAPIVYLRNSLDIPYSHHEKWDGTGYPRQLKGETIPLAARIFSVVDVYDALTSDRPYRKAWSREKTIEYIIDQSGKHFDPHVVDEFLKLIAA